MPMSDDIQKSVEAIRLRARELGVSSEWHQSTADAEVLGALIDGTVSFADVDDHSYAGCRWVHPQRGHR
jgi:hypothetical protein